MLSPLIIRQFEKLQQRYPAASLEELASGAGLVTIANFPLPPGWSAESTTVWFLVPNGYPGPAPDCFWADHELRLASGGTPQASSAPIQIPDTNLQGLWFSWHVTDSASNWNPSRDDLSTYASIIAARFAQPQ